MRILLSICFSCLLSLGLVAQEDETSDSQQRIQQFSTAKRNEVSIDVISAIAIPALNPRYEYILGRYSGVGVDLFVAIDGDDEFDNYSEYESFSITPYYRQYFFPNRIMALKVFMPKGLLSSSLLMILPIVASMIHTLKKVILKLPLELE